jgi:hypothetical protein
MKKLIKTLLIAALLTTGAAGASAAEVSPQQVVADPGTGGTGGK